ncbi:hypothetical protein [Undibacterium sp. Di24W]|uniref:hypothetical protein n=1 Tax=Undibacterium sp. Di24W TaxID=3413033 RepID=UPI003BF0959F
MKSFLKFGVALVLFGLLLSALGVGIIRSHAVKSQAAPVAASETDSSNASAPATKPTKP